MSSEPVRTPLNERRAVGAPDEDIGAQVGGFGRGAKADVWVAAIKPDAPNQQVSPVHLCLVPRSRAEVDAFHAAAVAAGGQDNGAPGLRAHYHSSYYAAFVYDLDGNNIEAVYHG